MKVHLLSYACSGLALVTLDNAAAAPKLETIYTFTKKGEAGYYGGAFLFRDGAGNLYSTTDRGGGEGGGVTFKLAPSGKLTVLYRQSNRQIGGRDIRFVDPQGNVFGEDSAGGDSTIFELTPNGQFVTIYDFHRASVGVGAFLPESDGSFIGSTDNFNQTNIIFNLTLNGQLTILLSRSDIAPLDLVRDASGNIFAADDGTLNYGGDIFEYSAAGVFTVLHEFTGSPDGFAPNSISLDAHGNLIGATAVGGKSGGKTRRKGYGSVYKVTPQGTEVFDLSMKKNIGRYPDKKLLPDGKGNYISIAGHGSRGAPCGGIFKLTSTGHLESIYKFQGGADGCFPNSNLVPDGAGGFYGTTYGYSKLGTLGTIYHLTL